MHHSCVLSFVLHSRSDEGTPPSAASLWSWYLSPLSSQSRTLQLAVLFQSWTLVPNMLCRFDYEVAGDMTKEMRMGLICWLPMLFLAESCPLSAFIALPGGGCKFMYSHSCFFGVNRQLWVGMYSLSTDLVVVIIYQWLCFVVDAQTSIPLPDGEETLDSLPSDLFLSGLVAVRREVRERRYVIIYSRHDPVAVQMADRKAFPFFLSLIWG